MDGFGERRSVGVERRSIMMIGIHLFVGIGALAGGIMAFYSVEHDILNLSADTMLQRGPFESFLIPGLFLFFIIGVGNLLAAWQVYTKSNHLRVISGCLGLILCMWILVQCYVLNGINALHVIYFLIGCLQIFLAYMHTSSES